MAKTNLEELPWNFILVLIFNFQYIKIAKLVKKGQWWWLTQNQNTLKTTLTKWAQSSSVNSTTLYTQYIINFQNSFNR